ncbi:hypothetical protein C8Q70DRAFT_1058459 [Cubamyces menziesii]|nr:hypothetical protein C8Q70DRAFT_1058459 [Cubamyces menziesii]
MISNNIFVAMHDQDNPASFGTLGGPTLLTNAQSLPPGGAEYSDPILKATGPATACPSFVEFASSQEASAILELAYAHKYGPAASAAPHVGPRGYNDMQGVLQPPDDAIQPYMDVGLPPGAQYPPFVHPVPMAGTPYPPPIFGASNAPVAFDTSGCNLIYGGTGLLAEGVPVAFDPFGGSLPPPLLPYVPQPAQIPFHSTFSDASHGVETAWAQQSFGAGGDPDETPNPRPGDPYAQQRNDASLGFMDSVDRPHNSLAPSTPGNWSCQASNYPVMPTPDRSAFSGSESSSPSASASSPSTSAPSPSASATSFSASASSPSASSTSAGTDILPTPHPPLAGQNGYQDMSDRLIYEHSVIIHNQEYAVPTWIDDNNIKWYFCSHPGCNGRIREHRRNLLGHIREQHDPDRTRWQCHRCAKSFTRERDLRRHVKEDHSTHTH